jgi:YidC/Oxa1 family membrane protein insertase
MGAIFDGIKDGLGWLLAFFYDIVPSYGIAIIFLTVLINAVLFPLTLKQTRSTRAFQTIQPDIKRLQTKYKDDPQTMQQEMMKLQREAGATPGGCLIPLLVQMPIWFALFQVLRTPEDWIPAGTALLADILEGASRFLTMDLGAYPSRIFEADGLLKTIPYLLLIALMVAMQFLQQWHAQPKGVQQDRQARQMQAVTKFMPLFIGFISWNFPAGLTLYWATANIFRLGQQVLIFRMEGRPPTPARSESGPGESEKPAPAPVKPQGSAKKRRRRRRK